MIAALVLAALVAAPAGSPAWAEGADVVEHLGAQVPRDLAFTDTGGHPVRLGALFDGTHPVLLVLAYTSCPQLCSLVLDGTVAAVRALPGLTAGVDYRVATISFDVHERRELAAAKRAQLLARLGPVDWPFLAGDEPAITQLTRALGFQFLRDPRTGALAHAAVVFVLTPDGRISRYLYGVEPPVRDLKLALLEAAGGAIGSTADRLLIRCFRYDPATRRYGPQIARFLQLGGLVIFAIVATGVALLVRAERRRA
jgi:protein SCO1/2